MLKLGVEPNDIIYANPSKDIKHLKFAKENGIKRMTVDCVEEC